MAKILVVEDDADLSQVIVTKLASDQHTVEVANDGRLGLDYLKLNTYDVVILDWQLPSLSGLDILKEFRRTGGETPVLMLTGKNSEEEKETGLDTGADDYLTKPFGTRELLARVRSLLRRPPTIQARVLQCGDVVLDPTSHRVTRCGVDVKVQPKDFTLLEFLMRNPGQVFSPEALLARVWHADSEASIDGLRAAIKRIRKAVDKGEDETQSIICTVPRIGYRLGG